MAYGHTLFRCCVLLGAFFHFSAELTAIQMAVWPAWACLLLNGGPIRVPIGGGKHLTTSRGRPIGKTLKSSRAIPEDIRKMG